MKVTLAANNGQVGGGEVMLLRCADAAAAWGAEVEVRGMTEPGEVAAAARALGHLTHTYGRADSRASYALGLRRADRNRSGVLWCHGLVPALATAGRPQRLVHLHQLPRTPGQQLAVRAARRGALATVVPSAAMASRLPGAEVLPNWTPAPQVSRPERTDVLRVGFIGRMSQAKGLPWLAQALTDARARGHSLELVIAGDARFVPRAESDAVEAALSDLGGQVRRLGWTDTASALAEVDVLAVPSLAFESFGLVAAEAMAAHVPVVVSNAGALPEVVGSPHPYVVTAGSVVDLADALLTAVDDAPAVSAAYDRWQSTYSPEAGHKAVAALLERWR